MGHETGNRYSHRYGLVPRKYISKIAYIKPNFNDKDGCQKIYFLLERKLKYREIETILSVSRKTIVKVKKQHMETKK